MYGDPANWSLRSDGVLVNVESHGWANPRRWRSEAEDVFCHFYVPRPGDVVVDVGAGVGTELPYFAHCVGEEGRVVCIEAHPETFERLKLLERLNRGRSIRCRVDFLQTAAASEPGVLHLTDDGVSVENRISHDAVGVPVQARTLDEIMVELGIETVDFLKMNIEGAEVDALNGARLTMTRARHGAISCHDSLADQRDDQSLRTKQQVRALLATMGFAVSDRPEAHQPWTRDYLYFSRLSDGEAELGASD